MTAPVASARHTPMGDDSRADDVETIWLVEAALRLEAAIASGDGEAAQAVIETVIAQDLVMACHPAILRNRSSDYRAGVDRFARALAAGIDAFGTILGGTDIGDRLNAASGRTALMLSGGGTLGNYHLGVVRTLQRGPLRLIARRDIRCRYVDELAVHTVCDDPAWHVIPRNHGDMIWRLHREQTCL